MADLIAKSPCADLLPITIGENTLTELNPAHITSITARAGQAATLAEAFKTAQGIAVPKPNRTTGKADNRAIWFGQNQTLLIGAAAPTNLSSLASLTDQTDAWAILRLEGPQAVEILARLTPIDLRNTAFKRGHTARTAFAHMNCSLTRTGENTFQIMVFRSMAQTAVHELKTNMQNINARLTG